MKIVNRVMLKQSSDEPRNKNVTKKYRSSFALIPITFSLNPIRQIKAEGEF
jgi:hypothetical protein